MSAASEPLLDVRGLRIEIPTDGVVTTPVRNVDLHVRKGETLAIVGESGCGKSLTSLAIMGLLPPRARMTAETVNLLGQPLTGLTERRWRKLRGDRVAMIFQDPMTALDPCYTIGDQMVEVLRQHRKVSRAEALARAESLLDQVHIPSPAERLHQYPHQLSGGLRQRVVIAMSLLCEPDLIIADEPTTALDVTIQAQILNLLAEVQRKTGVGLVLITHDIGVVAGIADRIAVMYSGQVIETGSVDAILAAPLHPYTEGLMQSIPVPGRTARGEDLGYIPGTVPRPLEPLRECAFAGRCPYVEARCRSGAIALRTVSDGPPQRTLRCLLSADPTARDVTVWHRDRASTGSPS